MTSTGIKPGVYFDMTNEAYHAAEGISKSGLWTIATKSPAHFKFGERKETQAFDFGEAVHFAVLQPNEFETRVHRGPDDRRGNKWKDAAEWCGINGKLILTAGDFDKALTIRDAVHADAWINSIITEGEREIEASGFWKDQETGVLCRHRPDLYRRDLRIMIDVKTTRDAGPDAFARAVVNYGYHAQEAHYTDGSVELDRPVDGFVFLALEKEPPYAFALYELPPSIVEEGRAVIRKSLNTYADCLRANVWPAYGLGVQELSFKRWAYRETEAPFEEDEAA